MYSKIQYTMLTNQLINNRYSNIFHYNLFINSVILKKSFNLDSVVADYFPVAEIQSIHTHEDGGKIF